MEQDSESENYFTEDDKVCFCHSQGKDVKENNEQSMSTKYLTDLLQAGGLVEEVKQPAPKSTPCFDCVHHRCKYKYKELKILH